MSAMEELLETRAGLALANACFNEGMLHTLRADKEAEETGVFVKPRSPYFSEWAKKKREEAINDD